jgi:hypothetical protein
MISALALDAPLSIEAAGNPLGMALWNNVKKNIPADDYDDIRSFIRNNFNAQSAYNYILLYS